MQIIIEKNLEGFVFYGTTDTGENVRIDNVEDYLPEIEKLETAVNNEAGQALREAQELAAQASAEAAAAKEEANTLREERDDLRAKYEAFAAQFRTWADFEIGETIPAGEFITHNGTVYKVVIGHPKQADYIPGATGMGALFTLAKDTTETQEDLVLPWVQPKGSRDTYSFGARVTHQEKVWESTVQDNVWTPGVYGWKIAE